MIYVRYILKSIFILCISPASIANHSNLFMKKILLIEDDQEMMQLTSEILQMAHYDVLTAGDGKKGVELAFREKPDLIISDTQMPVLDGYGVLHMLQKSPQFASTPFILISDTADAGAARRAMLSGADDFISRPYNETELLMAIECRLRKAEEIRNEYRNSEKSKITSGDFSENEILNNFITGRNIDRYNRRQRIYQEGGRPGKLFYIISGKVKLVKSGSEGKELVVELCGTGDFLGHVALLEDTPYRESAETMDFTEVAVIPRKEFEELIHSDYRIAARFFRMLANNIADKEDKLVNIAYNSLRRKVADALIMLQLKYAPGNKGEEFSISLHRDDLAHIAGTATESLIRTLSDFRSEQLIDIGRDGTITIINRKKLSNMFN